MSHLQAPASRGKCAMITRVIAGFGLAVTIAFLARQLGALTTRGAIGAAAMGTLAMAAGTRWGVALIVYFVLSLLLSRWRRALKISRTASVVEKTGARDAWQVVANGVAFVVLALAAFLSDSEVMAAAAFGALSTSMADTSATEVGSAIGGAPRSIVTWRRVAPGTSGGVTVFGSFAMLGGAFLLGILALLLGHNANVARAAVVGGVTGALADSLLGSVLQERRRCPACGALTERHRHNCHPDGVMTDVVGGVRGFDNDWVNLTSTMTGALAAALSHGGV